MSSHSGVYLGAFMRVPGVHSPESDPQKTGKPSKLRNWDLDNISEGLTDKITTPEYCYGASGVESIWAPNKARSELGVDIREDQPAISLVQADGLAAMAKFRVKFQDVIDVIESTYGVTVVVDWGIVAYAN